MPSVALEGPGASVAAIVHPINWCAVRVHTTLPRTPVTAGRYASGHHHWGSGLYLAI